MKKFILFIVFIALSNLAQAANWYVRQGASGTASGADWTNAFTDLPTTLIRGDTYFIAGGSYPGRTFNTNASGTSVITIKGATVADHGTDTGWLNSYSVATTQAVWTSGVVFNTSYWVFDGNYRVNLSKVATQYGFRMPSQHGPIRIFNDAVAITDISVRNCAAIAPAGDIEKWFLWTSNQTQSVNNVTITGILSDGFSNTVHATSPSAQHTNWTFEHSASINGFSSALNHGEDINNNYGWHNNFVIRYNLFEGRPSGTGTIVVLNGPSGPYQIYGNIFKDQISGDGVIAGIHHNLSGNIYNNTFIRVNCTRWGDCAVNGNVSANVVNNIFYLQREHDGPGSGYNSGGIGISTTGTVSHNSFYDTPLPNIGSQPNAHVTTGNPFVNFAAGDYRLSAATQAGNTLTSPYNVDMLGATRGSDGVFDRGAFEFVAGGGDTTPPTVSSTVPATSATGVSAGANITATFSEALNPATVTTTTASIVRTSDSSPITSAVSYAANIITINPNADLAAGTQYTVNMTTGLQDVAGNALAATYSWTFTTAGVADTTPPTARRHAPYTNRPGVGTNTNITGGFSEAMDPASITSSTIVLTNTSTTAVIPATVSYDAARFKFTVDPTSNLAASTNFTVTVVSGASGVKDLAGNALAANYVWAFTTGTTTDTTAPTVSVRNPVVSETNVPTNFAPQMIFSEPMQPTMVQSQDVELRRTSDNSLIPATVNYAEGNYMLTTITPVSVLEANTQYTVSVSATALDESGNAITATSWNFTTGAALVENTLTISNETNSPTNWRIIRGGVYSSARGNCLTITNSSYIKVVGARFENCWLNGIGITGSSNIDIVNNYFENTGGAVYSTLNTGNIRIRNNKSRNTYRRVGSARGQSIVQINIGSGSGNVVAGNYSFDDSTRSTREDAINIHQYTSSAGGETIVENNIMVGSGRSPSACGIIAGDGGGSYQNILNNILYNPGQCGIGIAGGNNHTISGNMVYGAQLSYSNIGIYVAKQPPTHPAVCSAITLGVNTIDWIRNTGTVNSIFNDTATCSFTSSASQITNQSLVGMVLPTFGYFIKPAGLVDSYEFETDCFQCDFGGGNEIRSSASYMPVVQDGRVGKAAYFDGSKIFTAPLTPADFTNQFSFAGWFRRDSETPIRNTVYIEETADGIIGMFYGRVIFNFKQQNTVSRYKNFFGYTNSGLISATDWTHIAVTYANNIARLYINGVLVTTASMTKPQQSLFNALQIGGTHTNNKFRGLIDQFYVFNTELSQASVTALFNQTVN